MPDNKEATNQFIFTETQQELVAQHFDKDINELEFYEVCSLLDELIDRTVYIVHN